jgi:alkanesulfonate monooxygenase SsuD/methylene tetrahydromethanopterin reductase-like flavin-dependent oxidoreductase (luciferase family)
MPDYNRPLEFGYFLVPDTSSYPRLIETAQRVEELGLDLIGVQDHPYQPRYFDTWTLLTAIAAHTTRVRIFPDVVNLPLRPPAMLAKAAASLDVISEGRVEMGLGAGAFQDAAAGMGAPRRTPGEAIAALEEAIELMRLMWAGRRATYFDGHFYTLHGANPGPVPAHRIEIWLGAYKPRMLELTGRVADGWLPSFSYLKPDSIRDMQQRIDDGAVAAGRSPNSIRRLTNIGGTITDGPDNDLLNGPIDRWVDDLTMLTLEYGFDSYIFWGSAEGQLDLFAQEIVPRVRELVARERHMETGPSASV